MTSLRRSALISTIAVLALAQAAFAGTVVFSAALDGASERPIPVTTPGTGDCEMAVDDITGAYSITCNYSGLLANATAAHLHGLTAGVDPLNETASPMAGANLWSYTGGTSGSFTRTGTVSLSNLAGMMDNRSYVNIHSSLYPGGEIRGQAVVVAVANDGASWGTIKALYR